jgi:hypothetical protein
METFFNNVLVPKPTKREKTVEIPLWLHEDWTKACERNGWVSKAIVGKLLAWYVASGPVAQQAIVNASNRMRKPYADALRAIADEIESRPVTTPPDLQLAELDELDGPETKSPKGVAKAKGGTK